MSKANPEALIVCGGYLTAASAQFKKNDVDVCIVGDGRLGQIVDYYISRGKTSQCRKTTKIRGIAVLDNNELKFSGYGQTLSSCDLLSLLLNIQLAFKEIMRH